MTDTNRRSVRAIRDEILKSSHIEPPRRTPTADDPDRKRHTRVSDVRDEILAKNRQLRHKADDAD